MNEFYNKTTTSQPLSDTYKAMLNFGTNLQDSVNHPSHYNFGQFEVIDVIEDWDLGFNLGNVVKYVARAGKKDVQKEIEDLEKAQFYLNRQIELLKKGRE